ncbi:hypothetical protein NHQ30_009966 [Ciborinia camelliae]|nr:hypothetical protein NHQ30_009966 [Ciborinia camelliae]
MMTSPSSTEAHTLTIGIGPNSYLLGEGLQTDIEIDSNGTPEPVTILSVNGDNDSITPSWLLSKYEELSRLDDVWCDAFTRHIFVHNTPGVLSLVTSSGTPQAQETKNFRYRGDPLPTGPYVLSGSTIHPVYKLYPDPLNAFVYGVIPTSLGSNRFPLSGKRIAVKDIFDLEGVKTTVCSKAYEALQDASRKTAPSIQKLIDQGAVIIGKVKTTPFACGMGPRDWGDYQPPFNPRGDGYLDAGCSSAGSGAALAGYEWLDFTIGSDSLGSMVGPAALNGLFGIRPTHGRISCEGVVPISS